MILPIKSTNNTRLMSQIRSSEQRKGSIKMRNASIKASRSEDRNKDRTFAACRILCAPSSPCRFCIPIAMTTRANWFSSSNFATFDRFPLARERFRSSERREIERARAKFRRKATATQFSNPFAQSFPSAHRRERVVGANIVPAKSRISNLLVGNREYNEKRVRSA